LHHSEEYWKDPYKFDPDRWLPENLSDNKDGVGYIPFMLGVCINSSFKLSFLSDNKDVVGYIP
jgi:cytochrome P450